MPDTEGRPDSIDYTQFLLAQVHQLGGVVRALIQRVEAVEAN
jgi:hypothetical protein